MSFVSETIINEVIESLEGEEENSLNAIKQLRETQPVLAAYLFSESFNIFTKEEKDYLLYLCLVIWLSSKRVLKNILPVTEAQLGEQEESNWELLQSASARNFRDKLDIFFQEYAQEDLLAFVEDAISDDEDGIVSPEGREPIFIALKTIIDCLTIEREAV